MQDLSLIRETESQINWSGQFKVFKNDSDDMEPFIRKGSYVVIDTQFKDIVDAVYALEYGGTIVVKRLRRLADGKVLVTCDNQLYGAHEVPLQDINQDIILGRVRLVENRLY